ncbi:MAG: cellulose binding domain-containing protein [Phycisphaerales bacterium]
MPTVHSRRVPAAFITSASVLACAVASAFTGAARAGDTVHTTYAVTQDWGSGYQAAFTLTNNAAYAIADWTIAFDAPWAITDLWGARVQSHVGTHYVLAHATTDDPNLAPGQMLSIGWIGAPGSPALPLNATLNGTPIALNGDSPAPPPPVPVPAPAWPAHFFSPFVDATLWPLFDIDAYATAHQVPFVTLGFIVAQNGNECAGAWGGFSAYSVASGFRLGEINALRAHGGDVRVSFGGAAGHELALVCPTVESLRAAYQAAIDAYALTHIDFDIEGEAVNDLPSIHRRSAAIRLLQEAAAAQGRTLHVTLTLPVLPQGLVPTGLSVIDSALAAGVRIDGVNIMAMDYGASAAPDPENRMGQYAIDAATNLHAQLTQRYAAHGVPATPAQLWAIIGITPMLGYNDIAGEIFHVADAVQVLQFAQSHGVGSLSFWDANRDLPCTGSPPQPDNFCSGVVQQPYEFSHTFRAFPAPAVAADINGDGRVDGADLGLLLGAWGSASPAADVDRTGHVDGADLGVLLGAWTGG